MNIPDRVTNLTILPEAGSGDAEYEVVFKGFAYPEDYGESTTVVVWGTVADANKAKGERIFCIPPTGTLWMETNDSMVDTTPFVQFAMDLGGTYGVSEYMEDDARFIFERIDTDTFSFRMQTGSFDEPTSMGNCARSLSLGSPLGGSVALDYPIIFYVNEPLPALAKAAGLTQSKVYIRSTRRIFGEGG